MPPAPARSPAPVRSPATRPAPSRAPSRATPAAPSSGNGVPGFAPSTALAEPAADSPTLRAVALLEALAAAARPLSLAELIAAIGLPKPTVHRIVTQLATAGLVTREAGSGYSVGPRLARLGRDLIASDAARPVRHAILQRLVDAVGETCNFTMLDGAQVVYLDRVETAWPLRVNLQPGSRVPAHCSASGKLLLAHLPPEQTARLIDQLTLERFTTHTIVERTALEAELARIRAQGYSVDDEEYLDGLVCVAVPVLDERSRVWAAVAVHGPAARMPIVAALAHLPALRAAAQSLAASYNATVTPVRPAVAAQSSDSIRAAVPVI
jgi:IclR family transcriptional regulator, acetate operon repressor